MATKKDETKRKNKLVANKTRISAKEKQNKVAGINIDIQKQVKETLRLQAEIMNNMAEGVVLIRSRDAIIIYTNQRFEKMFEYGSGELIGKNIAIVNAPTDKSPEEVAGEILNPLARNRYVARRGKEHQERRHTFLVSSECFYV